MKAPLQNSTLIGCRRSILATTVFAAVSLLLANTLVDSVFNKLILANIPVAALSFGLLAGFYWKKASWQGVYLSIFMGCFCGVGSYLIFGEEGGYTWYWAVYGIPLTFFIGILGSLFSRKTVKQPLSLDVRKPNPSGLWMNRTPSNLRRILRKELIILRYSGSRTRTNDLRIMIPLLYRLSYAAVDKKKLAGRGFEPLAFGL